MQACSGLAEAFIGIGKSKKRGRERFESGNKEGIARRQDHEVMARLFRGPDYFFEGLRPGIFQVIEDA